VCAELFRERRLVLTAGDGNRAIAGFRRELHRKMTQTSEAQDGHNVTGASAAVAQGMIVVISAHISGPAATSDSSAGMRARALAGAIT
jgi:hypothetical protein